MPPERTDSSQLIGRFITGHWKTVVPVFFTGLTSVVYGGFWLGQKFAETQAMAQHAELKGTIALLQTKIETAQALTESLKNTNTQLQDAYQKLQNSVTQKSTEISQLADQLRRASNCKFIHEQIHDTRFEINGTGGIVSFEVGKEWNDKQKERRAMLEKRLEGYQQQLGSCNK